MAVAGTDNSFVRCRGTFDFRRVSCFRLQIALCVQHALEIHLKNMVHVPCLGLYMTCLRFLFKEMVLATLLGRLFSRMSAKCTYQFITKSHRFGELRLQASS